MKFGFSVAGFIIFMLPMVINFVYFAYESKNKSEADKEQYNNKFLEAVEQIARILYAVVICVVISNQRLNYTSAWFYVAALFLILYYTVWSRYFLNGMNDEYLGKSFLFIPMPLAVFPVLYYISAAIWIHNWYAAAIMLFFGIAHNIISYKGIAHNIISYKNIYRKQK